MITQRRSEVEIDHRQVVSCPVGHRHRLPRVMQIQQSHERGPVEQILACEPDPGSLHADPIHDYVAGRRWSHDG
jgi:hypothetical protein